LAEVLAGNKESFESLLKRFNKRVQQAGILSELCRREHYEKPSARRKRKSADSRRSIAKGSRG